MTSGDYTSQVVSLLRRRVFASVTLLVLMLGPISRAQTFLDVALYPAGTSTGAVAAADFNRDGKPDVAVTKSPPARISGFLGKGEGTPQNHVDYATEEGPASLLGG